jgi:hypothetical protein
LLKIKLQYFFKYKIKIMSKIFAWMLLLLAVTNINGLAAQDNKYVLKSVSLGVGGASIASLYYDQIHFKERFSIGGFNLVLVREIIKKMILILVSSTV